MHSDFLRTMQRVDRRGPGVGRRATNPRPLPNRARRCAHARSPACRATPRLPAGSPAAHKPRHPQACRTRRSRADRARSRVGQHSPVRESDSPEMRRIRESVKKQDRRPVPFVHDVQFHVGYANPLCAHRDPLVALRRTELNIAAYRAGRKLSCRCQISVNQKIVRSKVDRVAVAIRSSRRSCIDGGKSGVVGQDN